MPTITFGMEAKDPSLNGYGNIYEAPVKRNAPAIYKNVKVRTSSPSGSVSLDAGVYVYWFQVQDGDGEFTVKAFKDGATDDFASASFDTAKDGRHMLQLTFEVTA